MDKAGTAMSDTVKPDSIVKKAGGQVKSAGLKLFGWVGGMMAAAAAVWFTPLLDKFIKPPKAEAEYTFEIKDNNAVTFKNLSNNAKELKWQFNDGSPIEKTAGDVSQVNHTFPASKKYKVILTAINLVDQESKYEYEIDLSRPRPEIIDLYVKPTAGKTEPAKAGSTLTFIVTADNAEKYQWDVDGKIRVTEDDRLTIPFSQPGEYIIRVHGLNGAERSKPAMKFIYIADAKVGPGETTPINPALAPPSIASGKTNPPAPLNPVNPNNASPGKIPNNPPLNPPPAVVASNFIVEFVAKDPGGVPAKPVGRSGTANVPVSKLVNAGTTESFDLKAFVTTGRKLELRIKTKDVVIAKWDLPSGDPLVFTNKEGKTFSVDVKTQGTFYWVSIQPK